MTRGWQRVSVAAWLTCKSGSKRYALPTPQRTQPINMRLATHVDYVNARTCGLSCDHGPCRTGHGPSEHGTRVPGAKVRAGTLVIIFGSTRPALFLPKNQRHIPMTDADTTVPPTDGSSVVRLIDVRPARTCKACNRKKPLIEFATTKRGHKQKCRKCTRKPAIKKAANGPARTRSSRR